jgi:exopolysaccharide production protein ExoF
VLFHVATSAAPAGFFAVAALIASVRCDVAAKLATPSDRGPDTPVLAHVDKFAPGDRMRLTVFEIVGTSGNAQQVSSRGYVERPELTGEYTIQQDGSLVLPFIAPVKAAELNQLQLEQAFDISYSIALGTEIKTTLRLIEREPVYVTGAQMRPAVVKYAPGMVVIQAIALAANLDGASTDWIRVDLARERERMAKSKDRAKALLARIEVLSAERDGRPPAVPSELKRSAGENEAMALLDQEVQLRKLEVGKQEAQLNSVLAVMHVVKDEIRILNENLRASDAVVNEKADFVKTLAAARARAIVSELVYHQARGELSGAQERWQQVRTAISQAERKLVELEQEKARARVDTELQLNRDIADVNKLLREDQLTQANLELLLQGLTAQPPGDTPDTIEVTIIRRGRSSLERQPADLFSELQPGDILQVDRLGSSNPGSYLH